MYIMKNISMEKFLKVKSFFVVVVIYFKFCNENFSLYIGMSFSNEKEGGIRVNFK